MSGHDAQRTPPQPARPDAAGDAEERALVTTPLGRWRWPLAVAAVIVVGVALGMQWDGKGGDAAAPTPAAAAPAQPPDEQLARIGQLLDAGRDGEARAAWQALRRAYPDYPVPAGMAARVEALPAQR